MTELMGLGLALFLVFISGASLGSFIAAATYRYTKSKKSIVFDRSECTNCHRKLTAIDLVPLFSFLFLRAKCRTCKSPISWRYFLIELCCAIIVTVIVFKLGLTWLAFARVVSALVLFFILLTDLDSWLIPISLPIFLVAWGLAFGWFLPEGIDVFTRAIGAAAGFLGLALVLVVATWMLRRSGRIKGDEWAMGWGDPILMAGIGALLGYQLLVLDLWLASIQAIIAYLILKVRSRNFALLAQEAHGEQDFVPPESALPFGTFLCLAAIEILVAMCFL